MKHMNPLELPLPHRLVLAMLGAAKATPVPRKLWLQKELFYLARDKDKMRETLEFIPYLQGPWSEPTEQAMDDLRSIGLVSFDPKYGANLCLTDDGQEAYTKLAHAMPETLLNEVNEVKGLMNDLTENELLLLVYETYPSMTDRSVVKEKAIVNRVEYAKRLFKKDKVSLERAAELAAVSLREFRKVALAA